jgi:hypothetical protein
MLYEKTSPVLIDIKFGMPHEQVVDDKPQQIAAEGQNFRTFPTEEEGMRKIVDVINRRPRNSTSVSPPIGDQHD